MSFTELGRRVDEIDELIDALENIREKIIESCDHEFEQIDYRACQIGVIDIRKCKKCGYEKDFGYYDFK